MKHSPWTGGLLRQAGLSTLQTFAQIAAFNSGSFRSIHFSSVACSYGSPIENRQFQLDALVLVNELVNVGRKLGSCITLAAACRETETIHWVV